MINKNVIVISLLLLPTFALAADKAVSTKTVTAVTPEQKTALTDDEIISKFKEWDSKLESLDVNFTQEIYFKEADLKQKVEGNMQFLKPNFLRIEHKKPAPQIITTDKKNITIYKPADKQAVLTKWDTWINTQTQSLSGILDFGNYSSLSKNHKIEVLRQGENSPYILVLTPASGNTYTLKLIISPVNFFPSQAEFNVEGSITTTTLTKAKINDSLSKDIFTFTPSSKIEIINL